ncbi:MAG: hypothetical protein AAF986_11470 [Pseudomonadota bacterium]
MIASTAKNERVLFRNLDDEILLDCHLLGKPTAEQLMRLHQDHVTTIQQMRSTMRRLSTGPDRLLSRLKPFDIETPIRALPYVYLDTRLSRRHLEQVFGVPYRRVPPVPSRDWRFLRHDVEMVDELITYQLTAKKYGIPFGYQPHFDADGLRVYPKVEIAWDNLTHTLRPEPDRTLIIGDYHVIHEKDLGQETIECGNIIRDATVGRKHLVYDALLRSGTLDHLGWNKKIIVYSIDSLRGTQKASRKRVKRCLETIPEHVDHTKIFFTDRQSFMSAGDDLAELDFVRGDGRVMPLPCWS